MDRISVKSLHICGSYTSADGANSDDKCQLCKQPLTAPAPADLHRGTLAVRILIGKCKHCFHKSCIESYRQAGNESCPTDFAPWSTSREYTFKNGSNVRSEDN
jgi:hypothetical protein